MKKSIKDLGDIKGKRALVRVDVNVPLDENNNVGNFVENKNKKCRK